MTEDLDIRKSRVEREYGNLQRRVAMTSLLEKITDTATAIRGLPDRIQSVRDRGYAYAGYLEGKAEMLKKQWEDVERDTKRAQRKKAEDLKEEFDELERDYDRLERADDDEKVERYLDRLEPRMERLEDEVSTAEDVVEASFGDIPKNVDQTVRQLNTIEGYLDLSEAATFELGIAESVFMAVEAEWLKDPDGKDKDNPDGIFYVTDTRIVMEQKEKVDKNFLGFGGKMKHEQLWEAPLNSVTDVSHENKGMLGGIDLIHLTFGQGGPYAKTSIEVKGGIQAEWFAAQLKRAASGSLEKERGLELDDEVVEAVVNAPTTCGVCGASFEQTLRQGLNEINCEYCGATTRLNV